MADITPEQSRAARGLLNWTQYDLADKAGVAHKTVVDFEGENRAPRSGTLEVLRSALEKAGVEFIPENGSGPGVRLKKPASKRKAKGRG